MTHQESEKLREEALDALYGLVWIIDKAGLINLSNGVQLGATSWYVKANGWLEKSREVLKRAEDQECAR